MHVMYTSMKYECTRYPFFCGSILTKASMSDDLTEQALDIFLENDTLRTKVVDPLKKKVYPYFMCFIIFNIILFIMLAYLTCRLSQIL